MSEAAEPYDDYVSEAQERGAAFLEHLRDLEHELETGLDALRETLMALHLARSEKVTARADRDLQKGGRGREVWRRPVPDRMAGEEFIARLKKRAAALR